MNVHSFSHAHTARFGSGATILRARHGEFLDANAVRHAAPSIFAEDKHSSRSARYAYIPTGQVLAGLENEGFRVTEVRQGGSRDDEKRNFTKHMVRLRHASQQGQIVAGDSVRELVLVNSHDGTSSYQLMSGLFRMVCSNGLIICENGEMQRVKHTGDVINNVIEGAYTILENGRLIADRAEAMQALQLTHGEQEAFAAAALELRFNDKDENGELKAAPIEPRQILRARREADAGNDMWRTFNRVQEHLINGGNGYVHRAANGRRSRRETRPVNSIDGNVSLNRALGVLAMRMAELKAA